MTKLPLIHSKIYISVLRVVILAAVKDWRGYPGLAVTACSNACMYAALLVQCDINIYCAHVHFNRQRLFSAHSYNTVRYVSWRRGIGRRGNSAVPPTACAVRWLRPSCALKSTAGITIIPRAQPGAVAGGGAAVLLAIANDTSTINFKYSMVALPFTLPCAQSGHSAHTHCAQLSAAAQFKMLGINPCHRWSARTSSAP